MQKIEAQRHRSFFCREPMVYEAGNVARRALFMFTVLLVLRGLFCITFGLDHINY